MNPKLNRQGQPVLRSTLVIALGLAALSVRAATSESNLQKTFSVKAGGHLVMEVDWGSIAVVTGDRPEVAVEVKRSISRVSREKADEVFKAHEVTFDQDGDRVEVRAKFKEGFSQKFNRGAQNLQVHYRVETPKQFNLDLRTSAGSITAGDTEGQVKARTAGGSLKFGVVSGSFDGVTSAGSITLGKAGGPVLAKTAGGSIRLGELAADTTAETSAGSITVESAKAKLIGKTSGGSINIDELGGPAEVRTSAGSITVKSARGPLTAKTSGGGIRVEDAQETVVAETSAGGITVGFSAQPSGDCKLTTAGGRIVVKLDGELAFDVDAKTSGGRVRTDLPVATTVTGEVKTDGLKGKLNGGGKGLVLRTSAGDISIQKR